jgi:DNA-binding transcriptional regulator YiaG
MFTEMTMSPTQCRMARAALNMSSSDLAGAAKIGVNTLSRFEQRADVRHSSVVALQAALEAAGASFVGSGEASLAGGIGVRLRGICTE